MPETVDIETAHRLTALPLTEGGPAALIPAVPLVATVMPVKDILKTLLRILA